MNGVILFCILIDVTEPRMDSSVASIAADNLERIISPLNTPTVESTWFLIDALTFVVRVL